ncbi:putative metalloprotease with PDZ domain [Mucilaginibacter yixingensis]|uniref:Putative metalloprotease with PDZ domain n=1 Tax=Mucilaginibacter yixingensis TaxID=1295612 RepID=A0A2T5JDZ5_9SPHI|nr:PDZ domain-containing protein [Mucilaginibacter yixingensis]PTQ99974.1 putative metalloprotease with PDZ domain [Mucilaginibacter yixingensis]
MKNRWLIAAILFFTMLTTTTQAADRLQIHYTLSFPEAQAHYTDVEMDIAGITGPAIDLKMAVWTPGSYLVREFARNIESVSAEVNGQPLRIAKINKNTWHVELNGATTVKVRYRIYCFEISVRTPFVDTRHGFISSAAVFIYPAGGLDQPATISIKPYAGWTTVSTSLDMVGDDQFTLASPNYDILFDSPIEVGTQDVTHFNVDGVKYELAMCLGGNYDKPRLVKDLTKMVQEETAIFGENPNHRYVFIVHNYNKSGGGLEHLSSTVLGATRNGYTDEATYERFLSLCAHEHFHLWNVKRLRPFVLGPFNYEQENYTTDLWIAEGFTNYYDNLVVHRMALYTQQNYLGQIGGDINNIENAPGNLVQPVADASFDAWIKYYRPNENSPNATVSYYAKGSVAAMMLDLEIIHDSQGQYSLDDVMSYTYNEFYKKQQRGYTDAEFKQALEKFAGKNLDEFYSRYIYGTAAIDYDRYLGYAGFKLVDELAESNTPALGISITAVNARPVISSVQRGSAAWVDGLNVNDEIVAIDGETFTELSAMLAYKTVGQQVKVTVIRDGQHIVLPVTLKRNATRRYRILSIETPTAQQMAVRNVWLKQSN